MRRGMVIRGGKEAGGLGRLWFVASWRCVMGNADVQGQVGRNSGTVSNAGGNVGEVQRQRCGRSAARVPPWSIIEPVSLSVTLLTPWAFHNSRALTP